MRFGLFIAVALTLVTLSFGEQTQEDPLEFNSFLSELRASNDPDDSLFASLFEDQELQSSIEAVASIDYQGKINKPPHSPQKKKKIFMTKNFPLTLVLSLMSRRNFND